MAKATPVGQGPETQTEQVEQTQTEQKQPAKGTTGRAEVVKGKGPKVTDLGGGTKREDF